METVIGHTLYVLRFTLSVIGIGLMMENGEKRRQIETENFVFLR